ncbi:peptidylprolyl isomerase [Candidatus Sumerlaeota bacterium]|nr:peptidylprolyl isomerase [Candidatus Sumerlaeota bacterium]
MNPKLTSILFLACMIALGSCSRRRSDIISPDTTNETIAPSETPVTNWDEELLREEPPAYTGEILVKIGNRNITRDQFEKRYGDYLSIAQTESEKNTTRDQYLQKMILEELLWNYAKQEQIDEEPQFRALLQKEQQKILLEYILNNRLSEKINVFDEEIVWYYNERLEDFIKPARIQVRHLMTATIEDASEALRRLEAGVDFQDVARKLSIHASRDVGGQLPPFSRGTYNKDFEDAAFALEVGGRSAIVKSDLGYHIIEKTGETPSSAIPFQEVKEQIRKRLTEEKKQRALDHFYKNLLNEASVEILKEP